ncbi:hypothetical protein V7152_19900 [Neobacillus drentensis]|uniref:hypothetical protein n=1 Tax=Neobacillus drentensis TaxID=220684 RepID=UPI002FFD5DEB
MNTQTENTKETNENSNSDEKELISQLEKQISVAVWIQFIGQIMETFYLSKIMMISEEVRSNDNERQILLGVWMQSIGNLFEGVGVTKQVLASDVTNTLKAQEITNFGDWIMTVGTAVEAHAAKQIINEEKKKLEPAIFVP